MALFSADDYDQLALHELNAAAATDDPIEKKRRLNEASKLATLAELAREHADAT